jgi:hypothetical protein
LFLPHPPELGQRTHGLSDEIGHHGVIHPVIYVVIYVVIYLEALVTHRIETHFADELAVVGDEYAAASASGRTSGASPATNRRTTSFTR